MQQRRRTIDCSKVCNRYQECFDSDYDVDKCVDECSNDDDVNEADQCEACIDGLDRLGLERKPSTLELMLPAPGIFGAGIAAGAVLGVMFAPKRGEELRKDIKHRVSDLSERGVEQLEYVRSKGEELVESARSLTGSVASSAKAELATTSKPEIATTKGVSRLP